MKTAFSPPSPHTTLIIILGASEWPDDETFDPSKAFEHAAHKLEKYFLTAFGLPKENLLWLFDTPLNARDIDKEICKHLDKFGGVARDVFVYYTGHGRPIDDRSSLYLAIRDTQAHDPEGSSLSFKSLARTLKAKARHLRRFYILDCCFAALGQSTLQGASVFDELCKRTLKDIEVDLEIPSQGYAGLFSSGKEEMSVILPNHENTFFTQALLQILLEGSLSRKPYFSLKDIYDLLEGHLNSLYKDYRSKYPHVLKPPIPQIYAGNIASLPFFPNSHAEIELHLETEDRPQPDVPSLSKIPEHPEYQVQAAQGSKQATPASFSEESGEHSSSVSGFHINTTPVLNPSVPNQASAAGEWNPGQYTFMENEQKRVPSPKQKAPVPSPVEEIGTNAPGIADRPPDIMESEIEDLGDIGELDLPDPPPLSEHDEDEGFDEDEDFLETRSNPSAVPRRSALSPPGHLPRTRYSKKPDLDEIWHPLTPSELSTLSPIKLHYPKGLDFDEDDTPLSRNTENIHTVATPPSRIKASFRRVIKFLFGAKAEAQLDISQSIGANLTIQTETEDKRQLYTVLDIGTTYARAMIVEVLNESIIVLGVGYHPQSYGQMSDGSISDIVGVITNCNKALLSAEEAAGGLIAPNTIIGIAGKLVKGSSITITKQRQHPTLPITPEELESIIFNALQKLFKSSQEEITAGAGHPNIDVRLTNASVLAVSVEEQFVSNPIGFRGQSLTLTLFSAFAPLTLLEALGTVAQGLDLTLVTIVAEPYALARCLSHNTNANRGAIIIDIGAGQTDIALVRQGEIEETRTFAQAGRTFTRRLAGCKGLSLQEAEELKITYSSGSVKGHVKEEIQDIFASDVETWMESIELCLKEMARGESLPPAVYMVGGGSGLPDLTKKLERFPWTERLPFSHQPLIQTIQPAMVTGISDPNHLLQDVQDITLMALAYHAIELQNEDNALERTLTKVIDTMHI